MDPKRAAYITGTVVLVIVDLIALNDITTASVSVAQVAFLVLSIPLIVAFGAKALTPSRPEDLRLPRVSHHPRPR